MPEKKTEASEADAQQDENKWPWDWFYYIGTVLLGMDERTFWRTQLRKLLALWEQHKKYHGLDKDASEKDADEVFIDQLGW